MVVFTCNACSTVLKRNKIDAHCYQCRGCESVSCIDCGKDFWGDEYQNHTKCISEEEKYGKKTLAPKVNKGEAKQDQWIEQVQAAIRNTSSNRKLQSLLERIQEYPNIPRKKPKFENFIKNSVKCSDRTLIAASWDVLMSSKPQTPNENGKESVQETRTESSHITNGHEKESKGENQEDHEAPQTDVPKSKKEKKEERRKKAQKKEKKDKILDSAMENTSNDKLKKSKKRKRHDSEEQEETNIKNDDVDKAGKKKKIKKRKNDDEDESEQIENRDECNVDNGIEEEEEELEPPRKRKKTKFDWEEVIKTVLEKKGELPLKKLKRKVLGEFAAQDAANYNEENLSAKFDKKVKRIEGVKVTKDRACLSA